MSEIGHNRPPSLLESIALTKAAIGEYLTNHPVIVSEQDALEAKPMLDRGTSAWAELDEERKKLGKPHRDQIDRINAAYKEQLDPLERAVQILKSRISDYLRKLQAERDRLANEKAAAARKAMNDAREADMRWAETAEAAGAGELVDVVAAAEEADHVMKAADKLAREADRAARDAENVRIGGGFKRAVGLRTTETLTVNDPGKALLAMGLTPKILDALISSARDYRRLRGTLPDGVISNTTST